MYSLLARVGARGRQYDTMLSLISVLVGISTRCTAPSPQSPIGSIHALGRRS